MNKYASVRLFCIATADTLVSENLHYAAHCSEVLDLTVHASFINTPIHLQLKRYGSPTVSAQFSICYDKHIFDILKAN